MPVAKPTLKDARQLVKSRLGIFQEKIPTKRATVGHSDGSTVDVEGKTDYIFVRIRGDDRAVWEVQNFKGPLVYNTPVIIKLVDAQKGIWAVDDVDRSFFSNVGGWGRSNLLAHAPSHEWPDGAPGEDPLNIYQRALVPLRAYPFDGFGLEIFVAPGIIPDGSGDIILYEGGSITIASGDLPISGQKRNALISLNMSTPSAPVVARTLGNPTVDNDSVLPPIPSLPADHIPLALVLLKNGDTQLTEDRFRDLRKIVSGIDSPGTTTFLGLTDTPSSFSGAGGYTVRVNSGATALEFVENEWTRTGTEIAPTNDADTLALYDAVPTKRVVIDPGTTLAGSQILVRDEANTNRVSLTGGTSAQNSTMTLLDASGFSRSQLSSNGTFTARDDGNTIRAQWSAGLSATDATLTLREGSGDRKLLLSSSNTQRILFDDNTTDVDINMFGVNVTGSPLTFWDESEDAFSQNKGLRITAGKLGIGTSDVPHGGIGAAMLALEGANASTTSGPHIQATTATDDRPIYQILAYSHDNWQFLIDSYYPGGASSISSDAGSNFRLVKSGDKLYFQSDTGIAQGSAITWDELLLFDPTNIRVGINNPSPLKKLHVGPGTDTPFQTYDGLYVAINDFAQISARNNSTDVEGGFFAHTSVVYLGAWTTHQLRLRTNNADRITIESNATRVGIGTTSPNTSSILDLTSTTGALLLPRMTTAQRDALTATDGMILFNSTTGKIEGREGGAWVDI